MESHKLLCTFLFSFLFYCCEGFAYSFTDHILGILEELIDLHSVVCRVSELFK